ncbi:MULTISPECIES: hypothetical protein [Candidatus Ichthyocystis]|uniref:Uncharacterized protein n=1 Tax=Candidatus Ichthyocystis hellenicum TaxID=1561003 RepID=A0A0S4M1V7_9BURK|nr:MULTISPECIES: hypothetical protein [Ichthyocystis]CUT17678.1 hypothetical protein Ark11_0855 [Candidatus Ichthyocystis hellenicum]
MYNISALGNIHIHQDDYSKFSVEIACQSSSLLPVTGSVDSFVLDFAETNHSTDISSNQLLRYLCAGYGYNTNIENISEVCDDSFLQKYSSECGYKFTDNFLSVMNDIKIDFVDKVDSVLIALPSSFSFFLKDVEHCGKNVEHHNKNIIYLINKACYSFSRAAYRLRSKCIDVLQLSIIPLTIRSIFDSMIVDGSSERKMTYPEMERLFLYFVTTLEKFIMVRIMKHWRDFCNENNGLFIDRYNPFECAYRFYRISVPTIDCPAAFNDKFSECISFMAIAKIDIMMGDFFSKLDDELKKIVSSKCFCICTYSDNVVSDLEKLREKYLDLVKEEFDKKIIEERVKENINSFLKKVLIWGKVALAETNKVLIDKIIVDKRRLLADASTNNLYKIIDGFKKGFSLSKRRSSLRGERYLRAMAGKWKLRLHPEDSSEFLSIKRRFYDNYKKVVNSKFCSMLKEGCKLLDGTTISAVDWDKISKNLFPVAQETVRCLVDLEHSELSRLLSNARVIENIDMSNNFYIDIRKITPEEIDRLLNISVNSVHKKNRDLFNLVWKKLISKNKKNSMSTDIDFCPESISSENVMPISVSPIINSVDVGGPSFTTHSIQSDMPVVATMPIEFLGKRDKIIDRWGLNLHPDDDKLISFIRRKFSSNIKDHVTMLFYGMLKDRTVLPSGIILSDYSWPFISHDLSEVAIDSVGPIVDKQYAELDTVLSKARIIDIGENSDSLGTIRKVTDDEKEKIMSHARCLISKRLSVSIRSSWLSVVNKSSIEIGYGYREKPKDVFVGVREGSWGVKLRYIDNVSILRARRKFSSKIKCVVHDKFSSMLKNKHEFGDGTFIGASAWFRVSKKLVPIASEEVCPILKDQLEELEKIISKSRVVVGLVDREITDEEKHTVLKNVMNLAYHSLKVSFRKVWDNVISSSVTDSADVVDHAENYVSGVDCIDEVASSSVNMLGVTEVDKRDSLTVRICHEDDYAILNVRRKFSFEICNFIRSKFSEITKGNRKLDDGTTIGIRPWRDISKKLLPIVWKEIYPIIERERKEIRLSLLKSRVDISSPSDYSATRVTREITDDERVIVMENIMKSVYKQVIRKFSQIWNKIVKLPLICLGDISDEYRSELDNIRLEFIGNFGLALNEVVYSSSSYSYGIVLQKSHDLFKEMGVINRVELLLSNVKIFDKQGGYRLIAVEESKCLLKEFMDMIDTDRECLIKKRTSTLKDTFSIA